MLFKPKPIGLRGKLVLYLLVPSCVAVGIFIYFYNKDLNYVLHQKYVEEAILDSKILQNVFVLNKLLQDHQLLQAILNDFMTFNPQYLKVNIYRFEGQGRFIIASSSPTPVEQKVHREGRVSLLAGKPFVHEKIEEGQKILETIVPFLPDGKAPIAIGLYASMDSKDALISHLRSRMVVAGPLGIGVLMLILYFMVNRMVVRSVRKLAQHTESISRGDYNIKFLIKGEDEIAKLSESFNEMCTSIASARLSEKNKIRQLRILHQSGLTLETEMDVDTLLDKLPLYQKDLIPSEMSVLYLLDKATKRISRFKQAGVDFQLFSDSGRLKGKGVLDAVLREGKPVRLEDLSKDPRSVGFAEHHPQIRNVLGVPLFTNDMVMGGMCIINKISESAYTKEDEDLLVTFAHQATMAIQRSMYFEDMQKTTRELESSLSLLQATLESTADGILVVNEKGKMVSFNQKFVKMWGIPDSIITAKDDAKALAFVLDQLENPEGFVARVSELYTQPKARSHDTIKFKDGRTFERYSQPQRLGERISGRVWSFRDITEHNRMQHVLEEQATRDPLTNLYNRRSFNSRMEEEIKRARRNGWILAILLCDIDQFKSINDTRGHHEGDEVLKEVAKRILDSIRGIDLVFRWGGDEFLVILSHTSRHGIQVAADRIRKRVCRMSERIPIKLDLSIGVALYPEHEDTVDKLVRLADRALYIAKRGGEKIHIGEEEYFLNENTVKVVFQSVMDLRSNRVIGYEALGRDGQGKISISEVFKKYNAIGQLNELKCLCFRLQLEEAKKIGMQRVFINVEFSLLSQLRFVPKPSDLEVVLEISEMEALHDIENYLKITRKWKKGGYKFAVDDFGAGFISLPFIARLVPDYIKIDRSTILQAVNSKDFRKFLKDLVRALRNYATEGIIAEGIETEKELQVVKDIGIYIVQGFLLNQPIELK